MTTKRELSVAALIAISALTGCATREQSALGKLAASTDRSVAASQRPQEPKGTSGQGRNMENQAEPQKLAAYEVRELAFCDFGMSVKTNFEVKWGGRIEWMQVSGVDAGSSAARLDLRVGDKILAIDGRLISELERDAMLEALFQRKKGDRSQFLVLGVRQALPRFVTLVANRAGPLP
jgi:predicted metalloprotease with PDZ domain